MRKILIPLAVLVAAFAAAATGGRGEAASTTALPGCGKASHRLVNAGLLTIGTDNPAYPPWFAGGEGRKPWKINDPNKGQGLEPAVSYAVAKRLGFERADVRWVYSPFNKTIAPGRKAFDFAINQISYTPERAKVLTFSASYYNVNQSIVGLKGKPIAAVRSKAGLRPYKLGAQLGTTSYQYIVNSIKPTRSPAVYDTNDAAVAALKNGQIDGLVVDLPTAFYVTAVQVPNGKIVGQFTSAVGNQEHFGMVFQKGNPLVACVNTSLAQMKRTGILKRIQQIWLAKVTGAPVLKKALDRRSKLLGGGGAGSAVALALLSTAVLFGAVAWGVTRSSGWPEVKAAFFDWGNYRDSFPAISRAFLLNVKIFLIAEVFILVFALVLAVVRSLPGPVFFPLRALAIAYADFFRGVPTILVIALLGFGAPALAIEGVPTSTTFWGIVSLVLIYTAYVSEVYRAGIDSVHPSQEAAARSLGLTRGQALASVVLPQAVRRVIPPLLNDFIGLQKDTALVGILGSVEAFKQAQIEVSADFNFTHYLVAATLFVAITIPLARFTDWLVARDRRRRQAGGLV